MKFIKYFIFFLLPLMVLMFFDEFNSLVLAVNVLLAMAVAFIVISLNSRSWPQQTIKFVVLIFYLALLFFAFLESAIYNFTGHGFNNEVYYHLSFESLRIGLVQYGGYLLALILVMVAIIGLVFYVTRAYYKSRIWSVFLVLVLAIILSFYSPLGLFVRGYFNYQNQPTSETNFDKDVIENLLERGFISHTKVPIKQLVTASTASNKNLIVIYLESFNQFFLDTPPFNEMTPRMQAMGEKYQTFELENSGYVTIEGLVSSMCGTLLPMRSGNDSFMPGSGYLDNLTCLSDVLEKAGYEQYFLGGATMEFAGKGHFLERHGYNYVRGMDYWLENGLKSKRNFWGLSDADLFDEAVKTIESAHQKNQPFNLNLLTLGTHIPGFVYKGCESIDDENKFTAAIRCTDILLTRFIHRLEQEHLLDNTLFVVVADHGIFPNPTMQELFGDSIYDRRLVAITNHSEVIPNQPLASYDLAPTLLDWLGVNHTAQFLFGQSAENPKHNNHKHITRYMDWQAGQLVNNSHFSCGEQTESDLLNQCEKENLFNWTQWIQSQYAVFQKKLIVDCKIKLKLDFSGTNRVISINGHNYYNEFYYGGYFMTTRKYKEGWFLFDTNEQMELQKLTYLPLDEKAGEALETYKKQKLEGISVYVKVQGEDDPKFIDYYDGNNWHQLVKDSNIDMAIDFCR